MKNNGNILATENQQTKITDIIEVNIGVNPQETYINIVNDITEHAEME